jgi:hypothetical protein
MGAHINAEGLFQSDKYPTCPPGKVPLSVKDKAAQPLLWAYAEGHRSIDPEFSDDLQEALRAAGYEPPAKMNEPGAILAELNALRKLFTEAVARLRRERKHVRNAEEMAPREAAEMLDNLADDFQRAYEKHLTGAQAEALAILQADTTEGTLDE